jgi:hypothetical protein
MNHQLGYRGNALNVPVDARARRGMRPASPARRARPDYAGVAMPALTISSTLHDGGRVLALDGEIDLATESRFQDAVTAALLTLLLGAATLLFSTLLYLAMWQAQAPMWGWAIASIKNVSIWFPVAAAKAS